MGAMNRRAVVAGLAVATVSGSRQVNAERRPDGLAGQWLAEDLLGGGVLDRIRTMLAVAPDGAVSGSSGCNRIVGRVETGKGGTLAFSPIAGTRMACPEAVMRQEQRFFDVLARAQRFRIEPETRKLYLLDDTAAELARFAWLEP